MSGGDEGAGLRAPWSVTERGGPGCGCAAALFIPAVGIVHEVYVAQTPLLALAAAGLAALVTLLLTAYLTHDVTVSVDSRFLRVTTQRRLGPFRGAVETKHVIALDTVKQGRELRVHRPAKNGGWNVRYELQLDQTSVKDTDIPGDPVTGLFREMVKRVAAHLGDRFRLDEDFGPMTAAVERQVAEAIAKRDRPPGS